MEYPETEPVDDGMLDVGDGHQMYWEICGHPGGRPVVVLHGGPGSGCTSWWRRWFDPERYRVVLFDQRNCGRSRPHASDPTVDLSTNTTSHLIGDIERLRKHLEIERWMVFGGSWGSTLGLAYAEAHSDRVTHLVLFSVVTTSRREVEWVTRDMGRVFPREWERFRDGVPPAERDGSLAAAYSRLLHDPDPRVREHAARDWCTWEDTHVGLQPGHEPNPRYDDPAFRLCFARLVTHYWSNAAWLDDGALLGRADRLKGIPGVLIQGLLDVSGPPDIAWHLHRAWPDSELVLIESAGHGSGPGMAEAIIAATDRFARQEAGPKS
ncbi:MAG: prolyl aminopeptidase [Micromonosporaceae bacterium]